MFPLYLAAKSGEPEAVKILLRNGANMDLRTRTGRSVMHAACYTYREKNIKLLASIGADILVEDKDGKTPFSLVEFRTRNNRCTVAMIKELALRKGLQPSVRLKDEAMIMENVEVWAYYQQCVDEVTRMKSKRFSIKCTFFELLTKDPRGIAWFMRNPEFKIKFKKYNLSEFPNYSEKLRLAFDRVEYSNHLMLVNEDLFNSATLEYLPYMIVKLVAYYMCPEHIIAESS